MKVSGGTPFFKLGPSTSLEKSQVDDIERSTKDTSSSSFQIGTEDRPGIIHLKVGK